MQMSEIDAQIGHFEQVLHVAGVRVVDFDVGTQDAEDDFASGAGSHVGITAFADNVRDGSLRGARNARESGFAIVGEITINSPSLAVIGRFLHDHSRRPKRLESHDEMSEMEFGF